MRWVIVCLSLLVPMLACSTGESLVRPSDSPLPTDVDVDRDKAIYLSSGQPRTLDPALAHSGAYGPIGAIFSGLVRLDADLQVQPELAAGWDVSQDGLTYTFYLRSDAQYHDGRPVTAQDIVDSWERAASPSLGSDTVLTYLGDIVGVKEMVAGEAKHISGVRAIDEGTLEVRIDAPKVYFLSKLTYPVSFVVDIENSRQADWEHHPNGTGAFALQEWVDDEYLILRKNDAYIGQIPEIDHVVYLMGAGIPLSMYEKGEIDLVGVGGGDLERVQDPNNPLHDDLLIGVNMCTSYVGFDNSKPPFDDPLVRQAFAYALDRDRIIEGLLMGDALAADGPLPPGMPGYTGDVDGYSYDPERAKDLLAQAGYADPATFPVVTFNTSGYGGVGSFVTALISMWQDTLGITIEPVLLDPYLYLDELYSGNTGNIFSSGWCADYPDPENFLDVLYHSDSPQNLIAYSNPELDSLLEAARVEPDAAVRMAQYGEIERLIVQDSPAIFLVHSLSAELMKPRVKNYHWTPIGVAQWQNIYLEE